jgi:hypothetical protein
MALPPGATGPTGTVQSESFYEGLIKQQFGAAAASKYASLYSQYQAQVPPTATESTAYEIFNPYFSALAAGAGVDAAAQTVTSAVANVAKTTATTTAGLGGIFSGFFQANIWIRVTEAVLGLVLIAIGLSRITKAVPIATSIAKKAGAVGAVAA